MSIEAVLKAFVVVSKALEELPLREKNNVVRAIYELIKDKDAEPLRSDATTTRYPGCYIRTCDKVASEDSYYCSEHSQPPQPPQPRTRAPICCVRLCHAKSVAYFGGQHLCSKHSEAFQEMSRCFIDHPICRVVSCSLGCLPAPRNEKLGDEVTYFDTCYRHRVQPTAAPAPQPPEAQPQTSEAADSSEQCAKPNCWQRRYLKEESGRFCLEHCLEHWLEQTCLAPGCKLSLVSGTKYCPDHNLRLCPAANCFWDRLPDSKFCILHSKNIQTPPTAAPTPQPTDANRGCVRYQPCAAPECMLYNMSGSKFCADHDPNNCLVAGCVFQRMPNSQFCTSHQTAAD